MKYKVIGFFTLVAVVLCTVFVTAYPTDNKMRYHQHLSSAVPEACSDHGEEKFCTHLPIIMINTNGEEIPGRRVKDENGRNIGFTTSSDGSDRIRAGITVIDNEKKRNHTDDAPALESDVIIHVRGNSSRSFDKVGYKIKLIKEDGTSRSAKMMGMDSHSEWVLHGPYLDKSLIRNYMFYNISGEIMDWAPNVRFCEAFINGEYQGLYVMVESVDAGKDGARLQLDKKGKANTYSGYILELDRGARDPNKDIETFTNYSLRNDMHLEIVYPGKSVLTDELIRKIEKDFSDFEKAIYSYDFDEDKYGYKDLINVDSFVDYFLINEFTCNYDAGWLSTYVYKDLDGKINLCVWDFNSACDNYKHPQQTDDFQMQDCVWYWMLIKDDDFTDRIVKRYRELRETYFSEEYLSDYIDATVAYLGDAIDRNFEVWGYTFDDYMIEPDERNPKTYADTISQIKEFIHVRGKKLDREIENIRQYSKDSKVKKFNEKAN